MPFFAPVPTDFQAPKQYADWWLNAANEGLWAALPNLVDPNTSCIVVNDGSGSMNTPIGDGKTKARTVSGALSIYFAERLSGEFKNKFITFSENPRLIDMSGAKTLYEKIAIEQGFNEIANTNIVRVFELILRTAIKNQLKQEELPANILIISDMEFDGNNGHWGLPTEKLFISIKNRYWEHGYLLPRIILWNVNSRSGAIPLKENHLGMALVSGFSVNICKMVISGKLDPYEALKEQLLSERYAVIKAAS